jgi:hypothetical protein
MSLAEWCQAQASARRLQGRIRASVLERIKTLKRWNYHRFDFIRMSLAFGNTASGTTSAAIAGRG